MHTDLEVDLIPALQQLQQTDAMPKLQTVLRHADAESKHRRAMDAQMDAHRRQQSIRTRQAQQAMYAAACCQSSTKPPKPGANMHNHQSSHHSRLRHEAEDLHQSSLNGRYWQTGSRSSHPTCTQHETLIPMGQRARNRAVRTKLSFFGTNQ